MQRSRRVRCHSSLDGRGLDGRGLDPIRVAAVGRIGAIFRRDRYGDVGRGDRPVKASGRQRHHGLRFHPRTVRVQEWLGAHKGRRGTRLAGESRQRVGEAFEGLSTRSRVGNLERRTGRVARVRDPIGPLEHVGQRLEVPGRVDGPPELEASCGSSTKRALIRRGTLQGSVVGMLGFVKPAKALQHVADARVRERAVGRDGCGRLVRGQGRVEIALNGGHVSTPQGLLVQIEQGLTHADPPAPPPYSTRPPSPRLPRSSTRSPFWTWSRFSDCEKMMLCGPSITLDVISSPR